MICTTPSSCLGALAWLKLVTHLNGPRVRPALTVRDEPRESGEPGGEPG